MRSIEWLHLPDPPLSTLRHLSNYFNFSWDILKNYSYPNGFWTCIQSTTTWLIWDSMYDEQGRRWKVLVFYKKPTFRNLSERAHNNSTKICRNWMIGMATHSIYILYIYIYYITHLMIHLLRYPVIEPSSIYVLLICFFIPIFFSISYKMYLNSCRRLAAHAR